MTSKNDKPIPPSDYQQSSPVASAGWFDVRQAENTLQGTLLGMFARKDNLIPNGMSYFFQIRISEPCQVRVGTGEDASLLQVSPGEVVCLNHGPKTLPWQKLTSPIDLGAIFHVYVKVCDPPVVPLPGKRKMANLDVRHVMMRAPLVEGCLPYRQRLVMLDHELAVLTSLRLGLKRTSRQRSLKSVRRLVQTISLELTELSLTLGDERGNLCAQLLNEV